MDIKQANDYPRLAADFYNSRLSYEYGFPKAVVEELKRRDHVTYRVNNASDGYPYIGSVNSVCRTKQTGIILSNSDRRRFGQPAGL